MIRQYSRLVVADNTGAKEISCITVLRVGKRDTGTVGDRIVATVKKAAPNSAIPKGTVVKAVIVRTKYPVKREDGSIIRFSDNAAVIIDDEGNPKGTRVFGPVSRELRKKGYLKIVSLAPEVL
ncbi:MAG: 50S ribosomal protein L14 [Caldisericaceae bacterium]|jgi:large subunit ribosomal protein L14|nr:50S ribosomal protein L14 [Caldisericaceae bacterium]